LNKKESGWHTQRWYKENYGIDPMKLALPYKEADNPYYRTSPPMKLWNKEAVLPFKNEEGIEKFRRRKESGKKPF